MTKTSVKKMGAKIFSMFCLLLCFALSISLADLFSSLITTNAFSANTNLVKTSNFDLYAICLYSTITENQAKDLASSSRQKNCAGYIYEQNSQYLVLASAYENKADAEKVQENLKSSNTTCSIITINLPKIEFSVSVSGNEKTALENAVCVYKNMYKKLYDLSVSVDTNLSSETESKISLSNIISEFAKVKANYDALFNSKITSELLELKLSLMNVENILTDLSNFSDNLVPYSSEIKHSYFEIINEQIKLSAKI